MLALFFFVPLCISANGEMMMGTSKTTKILLRIGILHDNHNAYLATGIHNELEGYTKRYGISHTHEIELENFDSSFATNIPDSIANGKFTAILIVSRHIRCEDFEHLFRVLPFFYISGSSRYCDSDLLYNRIIHMLPSDSMLANTMLKAMVKYEWTSAAVLYQSNDEIQYTFQDMQDARDLGINIVAYEAVGSDESIRQKLIAARRKGFRTYILVCSYTRLMQIMTIARELRLSTSNNHWFIPNVLLNPHVLHEFLKDGVHITFLHSPLVTPLTLDILKADSSLGSDGHALFENIVLALSRIAVRSLVDACKKTQDTHPMYKAEDGVCLSTVTRGHAKYLFCGPDVVADIMTNSTQGTTAIPQTEAFTNATDVTEQPLQADTRVEFDESCIIYEIDATDIPPSSGSGTVTVDAGHGHRRRKRETGMHSGMSVNSTAAITPAPMKMHATTASMKLHDEEIATEEDVNVTMGDMATDGDAGMGSMEGGTGESMESGGMHEGTGMDSTDGETHGSSESDTSMGDGGMHGGTGMDPTESGTHGSSESDSSMSDGGMHGGTGMDSTDDGTHGGSEPDSSMGDGEMHGGTGTDSADGGMHGGTETDSTEGGMHGGTGTDSADGGMHGGTETDSTEGGMHGGTGTDSTDGGMHGGTGTDSEDGGMHGDTGTDSAGGGMHGGTGMDSTEGGTHGSSETVGGHGGHGAELFSIAANFDPCPYSSIFEWEYVPNTCTDTFLSSLKSLDSNAVFMVEHVHVMDENGNGKHELLAVGGYSGRRGEVHVTYPRFKITDIVLQSREFVLGVLWNPPWLSWKYDPDTRLPMNGTYEGFLYDLIVELSMSMGFNFTIYEESAVEFGEGYNQTYEELESRMNDLFDNNTCDIFLWAKTIFGGRIMLEDTFGITNSFQQPNLYLLIKRVERDQNVSIWQFLMPFREESWVTLYLSLAAVSLCMTYINKKNPNEFRRAARSMREGAVHSEHMGIMNSLWFNFASLVGQSSTLLPYSSALKLMSGVWWFFVMLVISAYTANMISFMTQTDNGGITTIEQLVSQQEFDYGMLETNPMLTKFLPEARSPPYSTMWEQLKNKFNTSVPKSLSEALEKVDTENYILVATFKEVVEAITSSCNYDQVGDGFYKYQYGFPVPRGWQFLPLINDHLNRLYDTGTISEMEHKWFGDLEGKCETAVASTVKGQLDLKAFTGMYVLLILGVTSGIVVCIFETTCAKYGGIKGLMGRANKYEFRSNHLEHQIPDKIMEKEFENWQGGWEVIKHRPFLDTLSNNIAQAEQVENNSDTEQKAKRNFRMQSKSLAGASPCCTNCGRNLKIESKAGKSSETTNKFTADDVLSDTSSSGYSTTGV